MVCQHQMKQMLCHNQQQQLVQGQQQQVQQQPAIVYRNVGANMSVRQTPPNVQCMMVQAPPERKKVTCNMCSRAVDEKYVRQVMAMTVCKDCMEGNRIREARQIQNCIIHNAGQNGFQDWNQLINLPQIGNGSSVESSEEEM